MLQHYISTNQVSTAIPQPRLGVFVDDIFSTNQVSTAISQPRLGVFGAGYPRTLKFATSMQFDANNLQLL